MTTILLSSLPWNSRVALCSGRMSSTPPRSREQVEMLKRRQLTAKPDQRHIFLQKFCWPKEKCCKRKLKEQLSFVLLALCQEKWPQLEAHLMLTGLGLSKKGCTLTHTTDGFKVIRIDLGTNSFLKLKSQCPRLSKECLLHLTYRSMCLLPVLRRCSNAHTS